MTEVGGVSAAAELALVTDVEFILEDEFEELTVAELIGGRLLQAGR